MDTEVSRSRDVRTAAAVTKPHRGKGFPGAIINDIVSVRYNVSLMVGVEFFRLVRLY